MKRLRALAPALPLLAALACAGSSLPAWERPPPPVADAPVVDASALHRAELDNGAEVLVLEDHRLPRATIGVTVRRGAGIVPFERAGLAAFTAELMERGAGDRDALALAEQVDALGASLAVASDWDEMTVAVSGLSQDLEVLIEILADVVLRPRFDAAEARKVRSERLAALERAKDDPAVLSNTNLARALYDGHRYGRPRAGVLETVATLEAADARAFHARVFVPNDAILFAVGDLTLETLLAEAGAAFGAWPRGPVPDPGVPPQAVVPEATRVVVVDRPDLVQARIAVGHEGIARTDPERVAAGLLNVVVGGGGFSSRLMRSLRSEEGLTYSVGSGFVLRRHPGPFVVSTFTRVSEVRRALDLLLGELERARTSPPTEDELADAKALMVGRFALGLETPAAVMGSLVDLSVHGLPEDSLDTYRGRVRGTTSADTARAARTLLHPDRVVIVLTGPAEQIVPQVEDLGPVEIVEP